MIETESDRPSFIDLFAFHLATKLLGPEKVEQALAQSAPTANSSSSSSIIRWCSAWRKLDNAAIKSSTTPHLYFVDFTFNFTKYGNPKKSLVEVQFGALVSNPDKALKAATYVQSSPWSISDLESCTAQTGICVHETGPEGMARIISSSLVNIDTAHVSEYSCDASCQDRAQIYICIELDLSFLNEAVKISFLSPHSCMDGVVGSVALSMLMQTLQASDKEQDREWHDRQNKHVDEGPFITWWNSTSLKNHEEICDQSKADASTKKCASNSLERIELSASSLPTQSECEERITEQNQVQSSTSMDDRSSAHQSASEKIRSGVLHGVARSKKRKKGKLTFGKI